VCPCPGKVGERPSQKRLVAEFLALFTSKIAQATHDAREPSPLPRTLPKDLARRLGFSHTDS